MTSRPWERIALQPLDARGLCEAERDALIVSAANVDGQWVTISRYGDVIWQLDGFTSNAHESLKRLNFSIVPETFRAVIKSVIYRYLRRGRAGQPRPKGPSVRKLFNNLQPFLRYLDTLKLNGLCEVTPMVCTNYVTVCRGYRQMHHNRGQPLSQDGLLNRFMAVEALYELSQYTCDPIPLPPWPDTSAKVIVGLVGIGSPRQQESKTPLIPDMVFCTLFQRAHAQVERGKELLDLRDALNAVAVLRKGQDRSTVTRAQNHQLVTLGWESGISALNQAIVDLRTACYIVLASTSGCRNHELANVRTGAHHRTEDDEGNTFHWMRSRSEKTDTGTHDWMIPEAAVRALRLMERWAEPYQAMIATEIARRRKESPLDPKIAEAQKHRHALFLGVTARKDNQARTLSSASWNRSLKEFARECGLDWDLASHQFRRKFANYAAHSRFGDLRYLKEHFAHWSMDMTLGYAMDESWGQNLDIELYSDIQAELDDIKLDVVGTWLDDAPLSGGYGRALKYWQRDPQNILIFKSRSAMLKSIAESTAIRSNGHAWCTADNDGCVGNTLERTRCSDCSNAVIGPGHLGIYRQLYSNLKELLECNDIGESGRMRVLRDLERCRAVFMQLGSDPESSAA